LPTDFAWKEPTFGCSAGATCDVPYFSSPGGRIAGAPIAIDTSDLGAGATERFPHEPAIELIGVVLSGSVDVTPIEAKGPAPLKGLGVWSVFRAPGGGVAITATGAASARVVHVYVVRKGRGAVTAYMTDPESPTQAKIKTTFKREQPPSSVDLTKQTDLSWGGGAFHARIGWEDAGAPAVVSSLVFSKDAAVAEHVHEKEWECVLVLTGKGTLTLAGSPKSLSPGMMECVPPSTKHAWKGEGTDPFVAVQIYTPPGPEQRFKKLANP
jgi:quercetin dioxygenase-like cupin family protein